MSTFLNKFNFDFDTSEMKRDLQRVEKKPGDIDTSKFDKYVVFPKGEGTLTIRILPADTPKGRRKPYASTRLHYFNNGSFHCLKTQDSNGKWAVGKCPACDAYNGLYEEAKKAKTESAANALKVIAKKFRPIERYYYNGIQRVWFHPETGERKTNVGPLILSVGKSLHGKILRAFLGNIKFNEPPLGNIAHPFTGRDFKIIKEISKSDGIDYPNYDNSRFEAESVLGDDDQIASWLQNMWDLEAERNDNLISYEAMLEQVELARNGGSSSDTSFASTSVEEDFGTFQQPQVVKKTTTSASSKKVVKETKKDVSFDLDVDKFPEMDDDSTDWMKDLQSAVDAAE